MVTQWMLVISRDLVSADLGEREQTLRSEARVTLGTSCSKKLWPWFLLGLSFLTYKMGRLGPSQAVLGLLGPQSSQGVTADAQERAGWSGGLPGGGPVG